MTTAILSAILSILTFLAFAAMAGVRLSAPHPGTHCRPRTPGTAPVNPASGAVPDDEPVPAGPWPAWDDGTWQPAGTSATRTDLQVIAGTGTVVMDGRVVPRFYEQHWGVADGTAVINGSLDYREDGQ